MRSPNGVTDASNIAAQAPRNDFITTPANSHKPLTDSSSQPPSSATFAPPWRNGSQTAANTENGSTAAARQRMCDRGIVAAATPQLNKPAYTT